MKTLRLILIILLVSSLTSCGIFFPALDSSARSMREMKERIPEIIEIFELSKGHLDVLRDSEFVNVGRAEISGRMSISYDNGRRGFAYEEWDRIEWITDEEKDSIVFLFTSEDLSHNFTWICSYAENGTMRAELQQTGGRFSDNIEIWYGESRWFDAQRATMRDSYTVDLGDGYTLWIYTIRG